MRERLKRHPAAGPEGDNRVSVGRSLQENFVRFCQQDEEGLARSIVEDATAKPARPDN
ncbi:MAG: hypothetical protein RR356_06860 [Bacteroidales bacterium]